jgi:hypothetical protein
MPASTGESILPTGETAKIAGLILLALVQFRVLFDIHHENLTELAQASLDVLHGTPHHPAFQNRVLGSLILLGWSRLTGLSYHASHTGMLLLLTIASALTAFAVVRALTGAADVAFRYAVYTMGAALALLAIDFVFVWDFIEPLVFFAFAYGIAARKSLAYFSIVFAIAILNRESALAIPLWLLIDAFAGPDGRLGRRLVSGSRLAAGTVLMAIGILYTVVMRRWLFLHSSLPDRVGNDLPYVGSEFNLGDSLYRAAVLLLNPGYDLAIVLHLAWLFLGAVLLRHWRSLTRYQGTVLIVAIMALAVPAFGHFDETRQYLYLVPLLVVLDLAARGRLRDASAI